VQKGHPTDQQNVREKKAGKRVGNPIRGHQEEVNEEAAMAGGQAPGSKAKPESSPICEPPGPKRGRKTRVVTQGKKRGKGLHGGAVGEKVITTPSGQKNGRGPRKRTKGEPLIAAWAKRKPQTGGR